MPWRTLEVHSKASGIIAQVIVERMLPQGSRHLLEQKLGLGEWGLLTFVGYFVSCHDCGKALCNFEAGDAEAKEKIVLEAYRPLAFDHASWPRHEKGTAIIMKRIWLAEGMERRTAGFLAGLLGAHHQGKAGNADRQLDGWQDWQDELEHRLRHFFITIQRWFGRLLHRRTAE